MKEYNHFSEDFEGSLPIRALQYSTIDWIEKTSLTLLECIKDEIKFNGFNSVIHYNIDKKPISEIALIDFKNSKSTITLYESYNQYLWCICYYFHVYFNEAILKPTINNTYTGNVDRNNKIINNSVSVLGLGLDLFHKYYPNYFFEFPNPEVYNEMDKDNIEETNSLYLSGISFIILHEFAHHYLGHVQYEPVSEEQSKKEEIDADNLAISFIKDKFHQKEGFTYKVGIVIVILSLFFIQKRDLTSEEHPNLDVRLDNALRQLEIDPSDHIYGAIVNTLYTWIRVNKMNISFDKQEYECFKDQYDELMAKISG